MDAVQACSKKHRYLQQLLRTFAWTILGLCCFVVPSNRAICGDASPQAAAASDKGILEPQPTESSESLLAWLSRSLGTRYFILFLFLTVNLAALMVMNGLAVRRDRIVPSALIQGLEVRLSEDRFQDARLLVKADTSLLARVLATGIPQLASGYDKALATMHEYGSLEALKMRERLGYVWLIAQLAPVLGLIGSVDGLIAAFDLIAHKSSPLRPNELAGGIGTALVATMVGLWIAAVAVAFHQIIRNRMNRLLAEAGILAERFAERFAAADRTHAP